MVADDVHTTPEVRAWVLPSLKCPVAVNCCVALCVIVGLAGVTVMDCRVLTLSVVEPLTVPEDAVMVAVPSLVAVTMPEALTVATAGFEEVQLALPFRFCVLPLLNVPVAVSCWVAPDARVRFDGERLIEFRTGGAGGTDGPPQPASSSIAPNSTNTPSKARLFT